MARVITLLSFPNPILYCLSILQSFPCMRWALFFWEREVHAVRVREDCPVAYSRVGELFSPKIDIQLSLSMLGNRYHSSVSVLIIIFSSSVIGGSLGHGPQIGADRAAARPVPKLPQHAGVGGRSARRPGSLMSVFS